jgi:hypothetical protein
MRRASALVAIEHGGGRHLRWLAEGLDRREFWADHVAGHLDDGTGADVVANADGVAFRATTWTDGAGRRLLLLSQTC